MIVADIEKGTSDRDPMAAVRYVEGWTEALHDKGMQAMAYGSFNLAADLAKHANPAPDAIWVARYRTHEADTRHQPHDIPGVPNNSFVGRRAWQYGGAFRDHPHDKKETPARAAGLVCDISSVHAVVFDGVKPAKKTAKGAVKTPAKTPTKTTKKAGTTVAKPKPVAGVHVVVSGDTTFGLEDHFGLPHGSLFAANRKVMDEAARQHGHADSQRGHFIFPGTRLVVPAAR
jgi:LysM repeat protein